MALHKSTLNDVAVIFMGQSPPGSTYNTVGKGLPFFQGVKDFGHRYPNERVYCNAPSRIADAGDILFSIRAPIGSVNQAKQKCAIGRGLSIIRANDPRDAVFLEFVLRSMNRSWIQYESQGAIFGNMRRRDLERLEIVWPSDNERYRIGSILSAYDDLIENNLRRIQLLERAARLIYKEWFVHLRFPGYEQVTINDGVPEGWEKKHLSQIFDTQYGYTESATDNPAGPKFLRGMDINKTSYIDWSAVPYCPDVRLNFDKYRLQIDDILVIRMADPGKVAIVESDVKAIFASYLIRLIRKPEIDIPALYLFYALAGGQYQGFISGASGGTTRKSANAKLVVSFNILVPAKKLSELFVTRVHPMRQQIQILTQLNAKLRQARDLLLPRLMNGEITVMKKYEKGCS